MADVILVLALLLAPPKGMGPSKKVDPSRVWPQRVVVPLPAVEVCAPYAHGLACVPADRVRALILENDPS